MPRTMMPGGVPSNSRAWNLRDAHASIRSRNRDELFLAPGGRRPRHVFQFIHRRSADGAGHFPAVVHHGKQQDHPVVVIASDVAARERHQAFLPERNDPLIRLTLFFATGGGLISAILRRQSASEECGPETKVPLTLVEYQPDSTPRRSDSSVMT